MNMMIITLLYYSLHSRYDDELVTLKGARAIPEYLFIRTYSLRDHSGKRCNHAGEMGCP
jgi:hypothetical protein